MLLMMPSEFLLLCKNTVSAARVKYPEYQIEIGGDATFAIWFPPEIDPEEADYIVRNIIAIARWYGLEDDCVSVHSYLGKHYEMSRKASDPVYVDEGDYFDE